MKPNRPDQSDLSATTASQSLRDPHFWRVRLGLLPVPVRPVAADQYVLLNGSVGNFCLDCEAPSAEVGRSVAWSCDVGHYVSVERSYVSVQPWSHQPAMAQRFSLADVADRPEDFHRLLERTEPNRDQSIVAHALRVLAQLRSLLPPNLATTTVIQHFLVLVAAGLSKDVPPDKLDVSAWQIDSAEDPWVNQLSSTDWDVLIRELTDTRAVLQLNPDIGLLLRHASGALFQEAHYLAEVPLNYSLPGFPPQPARILKQSTGIGVYFTPPALARILVEEALRALSPLPASLEIFDPACGSGEFLKEIIRQLELRSYRGQVRLRGWDASPASVVMSRFAIAHEERAPREFGLAWEIEERNAIEPENWPAWPASASAVIMNPPFAAYDTLDARSQEAVTRLVGKGKPNLASAFLWLAGETLLDGGVLASIVPTSIVEGRHSAPLRERPQPCFSLRAR